LVIWLSGYLMIRITKSPNHQITNLAIVFITHNQIDHAKSCQGRY